MKIWKKLYSMDNNLRWLTQPFNGWKSLKNKQQCWDHGMKILKRGRGVGTWDPYQSNEKNHRDAKKSCKSIDGKRVKIGCSKYYLNINDPSFLRRPQYKVMPEFLTNRADELKFKISLLDLSPYVCSLYSRRLRIKICVFKHNFL